MVGYLREHSAELETVWNRHDVVGRTDDNKSIVHPALGAIHLQCQVLYTHEHGQALLVFTATPGTEDHSKLQCSRSSAQQLTSTSAQG